MMRSIEHVFSPVQHEALASLRRVWPHARMVLIGATALQLQRTLTRSTADIDLVIAIESAAFPGSLTQETGWSASARGQPQRWSFRGSMFDLLPVGPVALAAGHVMWPEDIRMNVESFELLLSHELPMALPKLGIHVAPVPLVMLLKMVAWLDRPERGRDIADLVDVMTSYLSDHDEAEFDRLIEAGYGSDENAQARLLGEDISRYRRNDLVRRFLHQLVTHHGYLWARHRSVLCEEDPLFAAFKRGLGID